MSFNEIRLEDWDNAYHQLLSPLAGYIGGQIISVDGGIIKSIV